MSLPLRSNHVESHIHQNFDHFDLLPDPILIIIFGKVADVKDLCRCCTVNRRFYSLVPFVENVLVRLENVSSLPLDHRCSTHVPNNFAHIRFLKIILPKGECPIEDGVLLKWRADAGTTVDNHMFLVVSNSIPVANSLDSSGNGTIPDFDLRFVLTMFSFLSAMSRHNLLHTVIKDHKSLDSLILSDVNEQGVLTMNREQLEEFRATPFTAWVLPPLNMRMWYAPQLDLPNGTVLKGATLVAARPAESKKQVYDASFLSDAFEEPFRTAAKMLIKKTSVQIMFGQ